MRAKFDYAESLTMGGAGEDTDSSDQLVNDGVTDKISIVGGKTVLSGDSRQVLFQTHQIVNDESKAATILIHLVAKV